MGGEEAVIDPAAIKAQAYGLGFDLAGITTLGPAATAAAFDEWLALGYDGICVNLPADAADVGAVERAGAILADARA